MTLLKDIQDLTVDTIALGTVALPDYFDNELVTKDIGLSKDRIENALNERGFVVVVDLPMRGKLYADGPGTAETYVTIPVCIQVNPTKNADVAQKDILEAVDTVCDALLAYGTGAERFETEDDSFYLSVDDMGLLTYVLFFKKLVTLSASV